MTSTRRLLTACLAALATFGTATASEQPAPAATTDQTASAPAEPTGSTPDAPSGIAAEVLAAMDRTADPCADFYRYACGGWLDSTAMPADQSRWSRSFSVIRERNREIVRAMLEEAAEDPTGDPDRRRIGTFYAACMDEKAVEAAGAKPLAPMLAEIDEVTDPSSLLRVAGKLQRRDVGALMGVGVLPDFKDPGTNIAFFVQGGLGMPDRDYYVSDDPAKKELLAEYEKHVARMLGLLGESAEQAAGHAGAIVALETELAKVSRPREEMRLPEKLYNKLDRDGFQKLTPKLPWPVFFEAVGRSEIVDINVATPEFFATLERLALATDPETLRAYLRWHLVDGAAPYLAPAFVDADFEFYGRKLRGQEEKEPRWKRCVDFTEAALGEAVGKLYVAQEFAGDSKAVALEMIGDIEAAFAGSLPQLSWMDETTRGRAMEKMEAIADKIGYPDEWRDYSAMTIARGDFYANAVAAAEFESDRQLAKIGEPVDRAEWLMSPQMVNAYYNPLQNEIAFPAGILQPPFFDRDFPAAMNYGGIGAVIGHELTHGFDDQGRKFAPDGQLREWWEPEVATRFEERAQCVRDLYSTYEVEPGVKINGNLTAGENIADIGGLKQSWVAYQAWESRHGERPPAVPGLTDDQLFFVAYGQVWCTLMRPEEARRRVTVDPHSPPQFRVMGAVSNHPSFAPAFGCTEGTPMVPANRCVVW